MQWPRGKKLPSVCSGLHVVTSGKSQVGEWAEKVIKDQLVLGALSPVKV